MLLLSNFAFLCPPTWLYDWEFWLSTLVSCDHGIVHLGCWSIKIFSHSWGALSSLILILYDFRPMVLLSFFEFSLSIRRDFMTRTLIVHTSNHVIIGSCTLIVGVLKYFLIFGGFVRFDSDPLWAFVLWCFCPILLFSVRPRDRMARMLIVHTCNHVIMGSYKLIVGVLKYFLIFGGFVRFDADPFGSFVLWCFCPFLLFSVCTHVIAWLRMLIVHTCIMWSWDRTPWIVGVLKYFLILFCFVRFDPDPFLAFVLWCFCPFLLFAVCPRDCMNENVDCPHLYHVIMGSYTLVVGVLKYFLISGGFVGFDSDPFGLSFYGAFVEFCFSLSSHVITRWEC